MLFFLRVTFKPRGIFALVLKFEIAFFDFVTTGLIQIRMKIEVPDSLLQEGGDDLLLDQDGTAKLLLETDQ